MKCRVMLFLCLGATLAVSPIAHAMVTGAPDAAPAQSDSPENDHPYDAIWTRNVFDLKPPEVKPIGNPAEDAAPPSNVKLMGIYTIFGKRALLSVQEQAHKGAPGGKEEYYNMSEGERHGALELLEINPTARTIKIKNMELVSTLTFETNRAPSGGPHPGPGPAAAGFTPPQFGQPMNHVPMNGNAVPLPSRSIRSSPPNYGQPTATGFSSGYAPPAAAPRNGLSAEEAMTVFYANQMAHQNDPNFPPAPPLPQNLGGPNNNNPGGSSFPAPPSAPPNYIPRGLGPQSHNYGPPGLPQ